MIQVFDNVFDSAYRSQLYAIAIASRFQIGNRDTKILERQQNVYMYSAFSRDDITYTGIEEKLRAHPDLQKLLDGLVCDRGVLNVSHPTDVYTAHAHELTILYYLNLEWRPEWGGETLFFNEAHDEITFACVYKPGRIIVIGEGVPHAVRPQTIHAPQFRFTLATFWRKE